MNIINLNVQDGHGPIRVVVGDVVEQDRLRLFMREALKAIEEKAAREKGEYRVKPETMKFRVALCQGPHRKYLMMYEECDAAPEFRSCGFIKWLTDWQEVEVNS